MVNLKKGYGLASATCGEFVQGLYEKNECIASYCIDRYSRACVYEDCKGRCGFSPWMKKSYKAVNKTLAKFGIAGDEARCFKLEISSDISRGKGMASSTSDMVASVGAVLDYLGEDLSLEEVSSILSSIEPTDSVMYSSLCIYDSSCGVVRWSSDENMFLGKKVLILEPNRRINTVKIKSNMDYGVSVHHNENIIKCAFENFIRGVNENNIDRVKKACESSALANESIKRTPFIRDIIDISHKMSCDFVNIAHTGTVVGICLGENSDIDKLKYELGARKILEHYRNIDLATVVSGGMKKGIIEV